MHPDPDRRALRRCWAQLIRRIHEVARPSVLAAAERCASSCLITEPSMIGQIVKGLAARGVDARSPPQAGEACRRARSRPQDRYLLTACAADAPAPHHRRLDPAFHEPHHLTQVRNEILSHHGRLAASACATSELSASASACPFVTLDDSASQAVERSHPTTPPMSRSSGRS